MSKEIFFGLVRKSGLSRLHGMSVSDDPELLLYLINDSAEPITLKKKSFGGFQTFDDTAAAFEPKEDDVNIPVEPHGYVFYGELYEDSFDGAGQLEAQIEVGGSIKTLMFYYSRGAGFMGNLIPVLNQYGRVIFPMVRE